MIFQSSFNSSYSSLHFEKSTYIEKKIRENVAIFFINNIIYVYYIRPGNKLLSYVEGITSISNKYNIYCFNLDLGTREKNGTRVATGPTKGPEFGCSNPSTISSQRFCQTTMKEKVLQQQQDEETEKPVNFPPRKRSIPYGITFLTFLYI